MQAYVECVLGLAWQCVCGRCLYKICVYLRVNVCEDICEVSSICAFCFCSSRTYRLFHHNIQLDLQDVKCPQTIKLIAHGVLSHPHSSSLIIINNIREIERPRTHKTQRGSRFVCQRSIYLLCAEEHCDLSLHTG